MENKLLGLAVTLTGLLVVITYVAVKKSKQTDNINVNFEEDSVNQPHTLITEDEKTELLKSQKIKNNKELNTEDMLKESNTVITTDSLVNKKKKSKKNNKKHEVKKEDLSKQIEEKNDIKTNKSNKLEIIKDYLEAQTKEKQNRIKEQNVSKPETSKQTVSKVKDLEIKNKKTKKKDSLKNEEINDQEKNREQNKANQTNSKKPEKLKGNRNQENKLNNDQENNHKENNHKESKLNNHKENNHKENNHKENNHKLNNHEENNLTNHKENNHKERNDQENNLTNDDVFTENMTWNEMFEKEISVNFNIAENNTESIEVDENKIIQSHSEMATNLENSSMPVEEKIDVLNGIAKCLIKFEQYEDALGYLNKSIELNIPTNSIAIEMRADIYHKLGLQLECLKDLIHFDCLNNCNANQNMAMFLLNSIVIEKTNLFIQKKGLPISKCHFEDFFRPFRSALPKNNEIATLIKRNNFRHINKVLMASDWEKYEDSRELFSVRMIRACLFFLKEMYVQALECLDTPSNILESLLKEFIMCYTHPRIPNLSLFDSKEIEERGHPTLVFFLAKLYLFSGDVEEYLRLMYTILEHPFVYYDLISFFKVSKDYYQMVECANEALEKFGNDPKWLIACGEYALITQDDEYLDSIIAQMDDEEPRSLLFKAYVYLSKKDDKELAILSLRRASALDLTCWEAYYNLGSLFYSLFTNGSESIWKNALHKASRYSEVYIAIRMLLIEEIKEYFNKE